MTTVLSRRLICGGLWALAFGGLLCACDAAIPSASEEPTKCTLSSNELGDRGAGRDAIPALTNPQLVRAGTQDASYLSDDDRVIGLLFGDAALAVPVPILWHHEIVNLDAWADSTLAVTYCPLTGSGLVFDRGAVDDAKFGVSGLLLHENLVMYDRGKNESLWAQMSRGARCGPETGTTLTTLPAIEMTWGHWCRLHSDTKVLSSNTGFDRDYAIAQRFSQQPSLASETDIFSSVTPAPGERVLGLSDGQGLAFPFRTLNNGAEVRVIHARHDVTSIVVFWHREARSAMAYRPIVEGKSLSFSVEDDRFVDDETGSTWTIDGRAVNGPKEGTRLPQLEAAHIAFWGAWSDFHPETRRWRENS